MNFIDRIQLLLSPFGKGALPRSSQEERRGGALENETETEIEIEIEIETGIGVSNREEKGA